MATHQNELDRALAYSYLAKKFGDQRWGCLLGLEVWVLAVPVVSEEVVVRPVVARWVVVLEAKEQAEVALFVAPEAVLAHLSGPAVQRLFLNYPARLSVFH